MSAVRLSRVRFALAAAAVLALPAHAQVTPPEPFGGRPFGAPPGTPSAQQQRQEAVLQQQPAPAPTVVQVLPNATPAQMPQQAVQPASPQPVQSAPTSVGPGPAIQASRTTGQLQGAANQQQAPTPSPAQPQAATPAPGTMAPPFARNAPPAAPAQAAAPAASGTQLPVRGLPADAPKLVITGSVYSPNPKSRLLIVNGQVYREGAELGQGLVLEQVHKESAVLGYKGSRYNVMF